MACRSAASLRLMAARRSASPLLIQWTPAAREKPVADQPPWRRDTPSRSPNPGGATSIPIVSPGATRFERLSIKITFSGARAASGFVSARKP